MPFLAVTGNVPTSQFNRGAFQETYRHHQADFPSTVRAYCKRVFQPTRADMVPVAVRQAWKTMVTGRPGPVVLDVPVDIFKEETEILDRVLERGSHLELRGLSYRTRHLSRRWAG